MSNKFIQYACMGYDCGNPATWFEKNNHDGVRYCDNCYSNIFKGWMSVLKKNDFYRSTISKYWCANPFCMNKGFYIWNNEKKENFGLEWICFSCYEKLND